MASGALALQPDCCIVTPTRTIRCALNHGWVAQLVEQRTENPRVGGSIPSPATSSEAPECSRFCGKTPAESDATLEARLALPAEKSRREDGLNDSE
jgi:hypothetical protein